MNNFRYRLVSPKNIQKIPVIEEITSNDVIIRPDYLSICAADQRYYFGLRSPEILKKKLPLSLIHECIGTVINNNGNNDYKNGDKVILYPNIIDEHHELENYDYKSKFMSSSIDGFMQEIVVINKSNLIKIENYFEDYYVMVLSEVLSVVIHAIDSIHDRLLKSNIISLWGDGNLSYLCHLYIEHEYPDKKIIIYGIDEEKLKLFSNKYKTINTINDNFKIEESDVCIEMVGGIKSEKIIDDIINTINPAGTILLLGVSENKININTRMILEKGLTIIGRSRSPKTSFEKARDFIYNNFYKVSKIITEIIDVKNIEDIKNSFEKSLTNKYKTVMKWEV